MSTNTSTGTRIAAGVGAVAAATGGAVAPLKSQYGPPPMVPAIHKTVPAPRGPEQVLKDFTNKYNSNNTMVQKVGKLGHTTQNIAKTAGAAQQAKINAGKTNQTINTLRQPKKTAQGNPPVNKGIAAARQKSSSGQSRTSQTSTSANKGISSFQNRSSGQSSSASKGSSSGASKGGQSR